MKVHVSMRKMIIPLIVICIVAAGALFGVTFNMFLFDLPWDWRQYTIIGGYVFVVITLFLLTAFASSYEVTKKYVAVNKGKQQLIYYYSDVVYIDEEKSSKKKMIHFYTKQGHCRYLMFDREGILYPTMLENCKNRLSKEEFEQRYPQVKL